MTFLAARPMLDAPRPIVFAAEVIPLVDTMKVRQTDNEKNADRCNTIEKKLSLRHAETFSNAAHKTHGHPPAYRRKKSDQRCLCARQRADSQHRKRLWVMPLSDNDAHRR